VGGSEAKKGPGLDFFGICFNSVFELSSPRNAQKQGENKSKKNRFWVFGRHDFFAIFFYSVFELPSLRNTRNRDKTKKVEETLTSKFLSICLESGKFSTRTFYFLQTYFYGLWCF
jgi:hypothetical protein